jgi:integrase
MAKRNLTQAFVDSTALGKRTYYWDNRVAGFGLSVGTMTKAYIYQCAVAGKSKRVTIGYHPQITLERARIEAKKLALAAEVRRGTSAIVRPQGTETLGQSLDRYLERCRKLELSPKSLRDYEGDVRSCFSDWLNRDLLSLSDRMAMVERHKLLTEQRGPTMANKAMRHFRMLWNDAQRRHEQLASPPTVAVDFNKQGKGEPIANSDLPQWWAAVNELRPLHRDVIAFGLFSGLRRNTVVSIKWHDVDTKQSMLHIPLPKGGSTRAFDLPLSAPLVDVLERRRSDNNGAILFPDSPFVFPAASRSGHIESLKCPPALREAGMPNEFHCLRHTYASAAVAAGVEHVLLKLLVNHRLPGGDITFRYIHGEHLTTRLRSAQEATAIELNSRIAA